MDSEHLEILECLSTGDLMNLMTNAMRCSGEYEFLNDAFTVEEIYEILKDREHTPNKEEAKYIRRLEAKYRDNKHGSLDR